MPIHLAPPAHDSGGPDGRGWNRVAVATTLPHAQCALRPRDYSHLVESMDTRRARWGSYGPCIRDGQCDTCPILRPESPMRLPADGELAMRIDERGRPWLMNRLEDGWGSRAESWTWQDLSHAAAGWDIGPLCADAHGQYFILVRRKRAVVDVPLPGMEEAS